MADTATITRPPEPPRGPRIEAGALMPWAILEIVRSKGRFSVSWRYRDERLRRRCHKLKKQGWLRQVRCPSGNDEFVPGRWLTEAQ